MLNFTTDAALINELCITPNQAVALKPYLQPHGLVINEMGYLGYDAGAAAVLFQVVDHRYHQCATRIMELPVAQVTCCTSINEGESPEIEATSPSVIPQAMLGGLSTEATADARQIQRLLPNPARQ